MNKIVVLIVVFVISGTAYAETGPGSNTNNSDSTTVSTDLTLITDSSALQVTKRPTEDVSENKLLGMIDSVLSMESVPMDIIDRIMFFSGKNLADNSFYPFPTDTSQHPANIYYQSWVTNHPHPYTTELSDKDSSMVLVLTDSASFCGFQFPIRDTLVVTSRYGWRDGRYHKGVDLDLDVWDPVYSIFPGVVRVAKVQGAYGRVVVVRHQNGLETVYAHLHRFKVKSGDEVEAGQVIGLGGSSGRSSGSHLHLEVRFKGLPLNPEHFIAMKDRALINDSIELRKLDWSYAALPVGCSVHKVKRGESLYKIAKQYGTTTYKLASLNGIPRQRPLSVGQKIRIH